MSGMMISAMTICRNDNMEYGITRNVWDDDVLDDNFMIVTDRCGLRDTFWVYWEPFRTKILNS